MGKKTTKNIRKTELRIIFFIILVAAAMFIISTYAWFSTQRNVSITNLNGTVEVAEGLEISLNAKEWFNEIVLNDEVTILKSAYEGHRNISPVEMLPVSTLGLVKTTTMTDLEMIRGKVTNSIVLSDIVAMNEELALDADQTKHNSEHKQYPGYFAFDIFLKNSSKQEINDDILQLNYDSSVQIIGTKDAEGNAVGDASVGLQNTVRVGFAKYGGNVGNDGKRVGIADVNADQTTILKATGANVAGADTVYITDVAIWEPNANDHVQYIVDNNNKVALSSKDKLTNYTVTKLENGNIAYGTTSQMPTYGLKTEVVAAAASDKELKIANLYNWDKEDTKTGENDTTPDNGNISTYVQEQITLQTTKRSDSDYRSTEGVQNLISTNNAMSSAKFLTEDEKEALTPFSIAPNCVIRLRVYVWLEGQDVDCINYASHGGGVTVNIGLVKGSGIGTNETDVEDE